MHNEPVIWTQYEHVPTFFFVASVSNERRASTSVETLPGMMSKISFPNSTSCQCHRPFQTGYPKCIAAKTHEVIHSQACLVMKRSALALAIFDGGIYQVRILWFVRRSEKQGRICRGILAIQMRTSDMHVDFENMSLPAVCTRR